MISPSGAPMNRYEVGEMFRPWWDLWAGMYQASAVMCMGYSMFWGSLAQYSADKAFYLQDYQREWDRDHSTPVYECACGQGMSIIGECTPEMIERFDKSHKALCKEAL